MEMEHDMAITTLTVIFWGHGNRIDRSTGYLKIFHDSKTCHFLFINDLLRSLSTIAGHTRWNIQLLMTQCWAHCHNTDLSIDCSNLTVDWLTCDDRPETSARRWDLLKTGSEMIQEEFDSFLSELSNYTAIERETQSKYKNEAILQIFLKYLHYASIHVEATYYIFLQRHI